MKITNPNLATVAGLSKLKTLILEDCKLNEHDLKPLNNLVDLYYLDLIKSINASLIYSLERLDDVSRNLHSLCPYCNGHEDIEEIIKLTEALRERISNISVC